MDDHIQDLEFELEAEELLGEGDRTLTAEDIRPVIEVLAERGVDLSPLYRTSSSPIGGEAIAEVSED